MKILLIEDDAIDEQLVCRLLKSRHKISSSRTGQGGLKNLESGSFDCVILDNKLPDYEGIDLLVQLVEHHVPVIMLTGHGSEKTAIEAIRRGSTDYLRKNDITGELLEQAILRAVEVSKLQRELNQQQRDHNAFIQSAAQHLRSTLESVPICCWLIQQRNPELLESGASKYFEMLLASSSRAHEMLEALARYARHGDPLPTTEAVDLNEVAEQALANLRAQVEFHSAEIRVAPLPTISGNFPALSQLFQSLIDNALTHRSEAAPKLVIEARRQGSRWLIEFTDNGAGIEANRQEMIFTPLYSNANREDGSGGLGLGLAICRRIAEQHRGTICVASTPGAGSVFQLELPQRVMEANATANVPDFRRQWLFGDN